MKKTNLRELIIYPSGICNLKCKYCYIVKNKYLKEIDDSLKKSFEDRYYYVNFLEKLSEFFNIQTMDRIALWGAEPSLGYSRCSDLLGVLTRKYQNVSTLMASSNMTTDCLVDGIFEILYKVSGCGHNVTFNQQISIDGPAWINETNRGIGTTKKIIDNFDKILSLDGKMPEGTKIRFQFKPTLSVDQIVEMTSKERIKEYFNFFEENFYKKVTGLKNISCGKAGISLVSPANYTVDDGLAYAEFCRLCKEMERSGECNAYLANDFRLEHECRNYGSGSYKCTGGFCGLGVSNIGLLPDYNLCLCHRTFGSFCENYNKDASTFTSKFVPDRIFEGQKDFESSLFKFENTENVLRIYRDYYSKNTTTLLVSLTNMIRGLANCGQILPKYKDEQTALKAAKIYQQCHGICAKDCYDLTGTLSSVSLGGLRLMLNGAIEYLAEGSKYDI